MNARKSESKNCVLETFMTRGSRSMRHNWGRKVIQTDRKMCEISQLDAEMCGWRERKREEIETEDTREKKR